MICISWARQTCSTNEQARGPCAHTGVAESKHFCCRFFVALAVPGCERHWALAAHPAAQDAAQGQPRRRQVLLSSSQGHFSKGFLAPIKVSNWLFQNIGLILFHKISFHSVSLLCFVRVSNTKKWIPIPFHFVRSLALSTNSLH